MSSAIFALPAHLRHASYRVVLVVLVIGILLLAIVPVRWVPLVMLVVALNAAGAVGDLWVAYWLLRCPAGALGNDQGDVTSLYVPGEPHSESL